MTILKPFIHWAGGKSTTINTLLEYIPKEYNNYFEPFLGSGRMLFSLKNSNQIFINDINEYLINTYKVLQSKPKELIEELEKYKNKNTKEDYYFIRENYNKKIDKNNNIELAAMFIYLMKTAYGGLYRVNKNNVFNTGYWNKNNVKEFLPKEEHILGISKFLSNNVIISCKDFQESIAGCGENDFIYMDPPYINSNFKYNGLGFEFNDHKRMKMCADELNSRGCKFIISNLYEPSIISLYKDYRIEKIESLLRIDSKCESKIYNKKIYKEIIILNY